MEAVPAAIVPPSPDCGFRNLIGPPCQMYAQRKVGFAIFTRDAFSRARESLQLVYGPTGIEVIRFQVRRLLPFRPCVSTGAVERVNVSLFRSSWAWRC